jgi:hypothetical protein
MKRAKTNMYMRELLRLQERFACKGNLLYESPIRDLLRGFYFESSAFDSHTFYLWTLVAPLYVPQDHISLTLGSRLKNPRTTGRAWNDERDSSQAVSAAVLSDGIAFLGLFDTPADLATNALSNFPERNPYVRQAVAYSLILTTDPRRAIPVLRALTEVSPESPKWRQPMADRAQLLTELLTGNRLEEARSLLSGWKEHSLRSLGLNQI